MSPLARWLSLVLVLAGAPTALLVAAGCFAVAVGADLRLPSSVGLAQKPTHGEWQGVRAGARAALGDRRLRLGERPERRHVQPRHPRSLQRR